MVVVVALVVAGCCCGYTRHLYSGVISCIPCFPVFEIISISTQQPKPLSAATLVP